MTLTEKEYIDQSGVACPNCDKTEGVEASVPCLTAMISSPPLFTSYCICTLCGATWDDNYTLVGYDNLELKS